MSVLTQSSNGLRPSGNSGNLIYDVVELVLDRGLVIDVFARVALVGIEIVTIDARVVVASVDTYLQFAEACGRLDLSSAKPVGLPALVGEVAEQGARGKVQGALEGVGSAISNTVEDLIGAN
jgi:gas vesicle structural protein